MLTRASRLGVRLANGVSLSVEEILSWGSLSAQQFWLRVKRDYSLTQDLNELVDSYDYEKEMSYCDNCRRRDESSSELCRRAVHQTAASASCNSRR